MGKEMKIQVLSDLHWEFSYLKIKQADCDVLVIAGDVVIPSQVEKLNTIGEKVTCPIIYITGNHEYYGGVIDEVNEDIRAVTDEYDHFHFLNDESVVIDGVRFIGSTLWSNFNTVRNVQMAMRFAQNEINDFRQVLTNPVRRFTGQDCYDLNTKARAFFDAEFAKSFDGPTVMVTHFLPSEKSTLPQFEGSRVNSYFACNCEEYMGPHVPLWIHGHTHGTLDYVHNGTRVIANPRGYHTENRHFQGKLVVEI